MPDTRRRCVERGPRRRRRPSRGQPAQLQAVDVGRISTQQDPEAVNSGSRPDPKGRHLFLRIQCEPKLSSFSHQTDQKWLQALLAGLTEIDGISQIL